MKEQLISFKTAKLAKEKGFDEHQFYKYEDAGQMPTPFNSLARRSDD